MFARSVSADPAPTAHPPPDDRTRQLAANLEAVDARLRAAAVAAGRRREDLVLVAVSKTRPADDVARLAALGLTEFGESRWQELAPKAERLAGPGAAPPEPPPESSPEPLRVPLPVPPHWHFLGRLQRNKARAVAGTVGTVHSLDRVELCTPLARGAEDAGRRLDVFVQVSLDGDPGRGGCPVELLDALADAVAASGSLRLAGLMAVRPQAQPARPAFARLYELADGLRRTHPGATSLSAGMSGDLEDAIAEGATHVRIGSALFGSRA